MITIDDDVSSYFTSASGEIDWLADFLRAKCLTQLCTVRLERIEDLVQLFSATAYSSCLGDLESVCSSSGKEPSLSAATSSNSDHVKDSELDSGDVLKSPVPDHTFVGDGQCGKPSVLDDRTPSEHTSTTDLFGASTNGCTDVVDLIELSSIIKSKCLSRECSVELVKLPRLSPEQQLMSEAELCENEPHTEAAALATELKEKCLDGKPFVKIKKMSITDIKDELQANTGSDRSVCDLVSEETGSTASDKVTSVGTRRKRTSARSNDGTVSEKEVPKKSSGNGDKGKRRSAESKEKKGRTSTHRPGTTRKACVSGLSVSRWKSRDAFTSTFGQRGGTRTIDCSINELIPSQHNVPAKLTDVNMAFSTPVKGHNLNFSSLLAELTPHTQTWSRLKAALSVHRKVMLTPKTPGPGRPSRMAEADLSQDLFGTPFRTPLPKRLRSQRMTHESPLAFDVDELSDAEKVYTECGQQRPLAWGECLQPPRMKQCVKIGEGTFGEVFSTTSGKPGGEIVALKVIPLEGSEKVNGEEQKTFGEILHEIIISKELSCLKEKEKNQTSGFIGLRDLHCVKGGYPTEFLNAWDKFDKQKGSENDRPDFFENEQLFIILEFEFGGTDLENSSGTLPSITVAKSILHQVTAALAVAEQELHFEHRDLHWGNVLVKVTKQKTTEFSLNGAVLSLETKGVLVRIIDYSLSRLEIDELTVSCDISNDEELFMGQGDYQFDIYRIMRQENSNEWSSYNPHSNVLWLHYLCSKLLDMKYCGSRGKRNKDMRSELTGFYDNVLQFSSATEVLQHSPLFQ
ncbi:serine/threonine-protein kinase haspin [Eucyclogobius newberryi]|uniref:serine/threonine-protein kinase haspin n=1 Tax=Eucyclogobius newberryi TaxID=166745 RepID=UPI003B5AFF50